MGKISVRKSIEYVGLGLLLISIYSGRHVIGDSFHTLTQADAPYIILAFAAAWLNFLWSALGYKLLLTKPVKLRYICLTHLAASGPGRVIPGGGGHVSFGILFLRKQGYSLAQAIAIATANNIIGFFVNMLVLLAVIAYKPSTLELLHISKTVVIVAVSVIALAIVLYITLRKNRQAAQSTKKTKKEYIHILHLFRKKPKRLFGLISTMLVMVMTHTLILYVSARAIHVDIALLNAFIAMSTGVAAGSLLPTPGGIGGVEAGIIASLYSLGLPTESATAAALLYRAATYLQPIIPGTIAYIFLRNRKLI